MLAIENAEEYIKLVKEFCLYTGVQRQLDAFRGNTPCTQMIKFTPIMKRIDVGAFSLTWIAAFSMFCDINMSAALLLWGSNMASLTSCEQALYYDGLLNE